jgi:flagellin-like hook-associated protein FlgL
MRVSDASTFANTIFYLSQARARQADTQQQIASGKRITKASDDPIGFGKVLDYRTTVATLEQRQSGTTLASSQLSEVDSALQNASQSVLARAEELAVAMTNSTNGADERKAAADELKSLIAQMLNVANTKLGDRSLFSGATTRGQLVGTTISPPSAGAPATITAGSNDTLTFKVDGVSSGSITLTAGSYATGDSLATEVQTQLNADATLAAAGKSVRVSFSANHLVIASNSYGSSSTVTVTAGSARRSTGLAGGTISNGADPFSLAVQTGEAARNTGGAVVSPGLVTDAGKLTFNDYLLKFTSATAYNIYNANSGVITAGAAANTGGGIVSKTAVNDPSQVTLDSYAVRFKNISTVQAGVNDQIRFDAGTGSVSATLAPGQYTGAQLAAQIKSALETVSGGKTYTVAFDESTAKYSVTNDLANATSLSLQFGDPLSTATA